MVVVASVCHCGGGKKFGGGKSLVIIMKSNEERAALMIARTVPTKGPEFLSPAQKSATERPKRVVASEAERS